MVAPSTSPKTISIAVVDDHPVVRYGLASVLGRSDRFKIVGEGASADEAVELAKNLNPDIMLLDLGIPGNGIEAIKRIALVAPKVRCIILTVCDVAETAIAALNAGARGYVLKGVSARDLTAAIMTVVEDASFVSPEFATKLLEAAQTASANQGAERLSFRETQILDEVENGLTNRQIAEKLNVSEKTVKYYMTSVMHKYGVTNRVGAVVAHRKLNNERSGAQS